MLRVWAVCLVGRCPCGEAVGEDVAAGRLATFGPGRGGGFWVWVLSTVRVCLRLWAMASASTPMV